MQTNSDFEEILQAFNGAEVRYLVVGAFAVAAFSRPRATGDIDLWVDREPENARRVYQALAQFGAPMDELNDHTFTEPDIVFQIGIPPIRVDILTAIDGVSFHEAWPNRITGQIGRVSTPIIGRADLIKNKRASGRPKDLADLERLEKDAPT
jgi:hypothetical protein